MVLETVMFQKSPLLLLQKDGILKKMLLLICSLQSENPEGNMKGHCYMIK